MRAGPRLDSVDFLRGAVVLLMVLVNSVGGMKGVPAWTQHLPKETDGYTITDMVLPWFLFLVGVSLPLSLDKFLGRARQIDWGPALRRILPRVIGLLVLGVIYVNAGRTSADATGLSRRAWMGLSLLSAILVWGAIPGPKTPRWEKARNGLKLLGIFMLVYLLAIWRGRERGSEHAIMTIHPKWWGILGIIGWSYLTGALVYLISRAKPALLVGALSMMVCVYIAGRAGRLPFPESVGKFWPISLYFGSLSAIVVAGSIAGIMVKRKESGIFWRLIGYGIALWAAGWLLRPLHGYHKLESTESWGLVAAAQGALALAIMRQLLDRWKLRLPAAAAAPAVLIGRNALLAYIMPNLVGLITRPLGIDLTPMWHHGAAFGMLNAALFAAFIGGLTVIATRAGFILRL